MRLISSGPRSSPARVDAPSRPPLRIGVVQHRWRADAGELKDVLLGAIGQAAAEGAQVVFLPELTLSRYPAFEEPTGVPSDAAEDLLTGPTVTFAAEAARKYGIPVHASLYEKNEGDDLGYNTAVLVGADGRLIGRTRKTHIPVTEGYVEDKYFRPGPPEDAYPVHRLDDVGVGLPTCWDEWFPEVARLYALGGADLLAYPTAIGSEPDHPDFDTQPLWQQVIVGHAIANGLFIAVPNRTGDEGRISFYGSSFVADPYGRILCQAPRDEEAVLIADLDLDQRRDWLTLFPFFQTRRPETYGGLA
ncbi:nitrilase-related carbon-nitrogen hydrolase [Paractinoplanes atraurantiacus]|uniref:N-carbamoylputrescine amidase n=1 Tax=Paractinoplanes atraurantiacus TaxID=1036182 RepID=A0A285IG21_9ACTN|nr:nitrilase-related carbon-nitrogen hydrolase [Actinoplanes atraurantiacus]SNY46892.1 N-carbamoylputrescine amidase [Actinoplanes atraurantiacus]